MLTRGKTKRNLKAGLLWLLPLAFLVFFFYQPLVAIFRLVFSPQFASGWDRFDLTQLARPLLFSLYQAGLSTLLTLALGLPAAWLFARIDFPGRKFLRTLALLPFILPTVVVAAAFNALIGPRGWLNLGLMQLLGLAQPPIRLVGGLGAIILAHVFYNTSIVIRMVGMAWGHLNPRLEEASRMLGASPWQTLRRVTLPLLGPSILGAALLVFLFDFTSYGVVRMLGRPGLGTLEVDIYTQAMYYLNLPVAGLLSIVQLIFTLLLTIMQNRVTSPRYGKAALASESRVLHPPRGLGQKLLAGFLILIILLMVVMPLGSLVTRSLVTLDAERGQRGGIETGFTLRYYQELFVNRTGSLFYVPPLLAVRNSLLYAFLATLIAAALGLLAAYALAGSSGAWGLLEPLFMLPLGTSPVTLGLGFLVVFNRPPWNNPRLPLLIPIAHALIGLPFVVRSLLPAIRSLPANLRETARVMGASPWRVFMEVDLPILLRALLVSMVFAFTISLGEFGAASFLASPQNPTIPVAIFRYISQPGALNYGQALAMSTLLLLVCAAGSFLIEKIRLPGEESF